MASVVISSTNKSSNLAYGADLRINYSLVYDALSNSSTLAVDSLEIKNTSITLQMTMSGQLTCNGHVVAEWENDIVQLTDETWVTVTGGSRFTAKLKHSNTGALTLTFAPKTFPGSYPNYGGVSDGIYIGGNFSGSNYYFKFSESATATADASWDMSLAGLLQRSGDVMLGKLRLTPGVHYGTEFPTGASEGQFFVKLQSLARSGGMVTGTVKTFTDSVSKYVSAWGVTLKLTMQMTMTQTYEAGTGKSNITFSDFQLMYSGGNIGSWTGYVDGLITATINGTKYTVYDEYWSSSYINKYNCAMKVNTYNTVKAASGGAAWSYTLTDIEHASDGSLSVVVDWSKISNVTNLRGYGLLVAGTETVALTANQAALGKLYVKSGESVLAGEPYLFLGSEWKRTAPYLRISGDWKLCN